MRIAFYAPFKPIDHPNPSGDLNIAKGIVRYLESCSHVIDVQSRFRTRWIYFKPWCWPVLICQFIRCIKQLKNQPADIWLTYHTYYKAPDLLGPWMCRIFGIKYVIFQGIYSTKRKRRFKTMIGFYLNRAALIKADHVFTNKLTDYRNLLRILPHDRVTYIRPGIYPLEFKKQTMAKASQRKAWGVKDGRIVLLTAAMFRDDVKTQSLAWLIRCLGKMKPGEADFHLVIAGSGKMAGFLKGLAQRHIPGRCTFVGKVANRKMASFYSAGDLFVYPGIRESLGMVYLEAQTCGLPVVAFKNGGIPEVVKENETGFLTPMYDCPALLKKVEKLISNPIFRQKMGENAAAYVNTHHDAQINYARINSILKKMAG